MDIVTTPMDGPAPLWTSPLPVTPGQLIPYQRDGVLVAAVGSLTRFAADGSEVWRTSTVGDAFEEPTATAAGMIVAIEGDAVVWRDPGTGAVSRYLAASAAQHLATTPWGDVLFFAKEPAGVYSLRSVGPNGEMKWSMPLASVPTTTPVVLSDRAVVEVDGLLRGLASDGSELWVVGPDGFGMPGDRPGIGELRMIPRPVNPAAPDTALLVAWTTETGPRLFLVDPVARTVTRYATNQPLDGPIGIVPTASGSLRVAVCGPRVEVERLRYEWPVSLLDNEGGELWRRMFRAPPRMLGIRGDGSLILAGTVGLKRWEEYGRWQDLHRENYVCCLTADGSEQWMWYAPGPLVAYPVLASDDTMYLGSDGRLWAFAAQGVASPIAPQPGISVVPLYDGLDPVTGPYFGPDHDRIGDQAERDRIADFMRDGTVVVRTTALDEDVVDRARGSVVPGSFRTDGTWLWNDGLAYYVREHGIAPPADFYSHVIACGYRCPRPGRAVVRDAAQVLLHR